MAACRPPQQHQGSRAPMILFTASEIRKYFSQDPVLDGASIQLAAGERGALVGPIGSGKTTLALAVARLLPVTRGQIHMNGVDLLSLRGEALRIERRHMQFIFQDPYSS